MFMLKRPSDPAFMTADQASRRRGYAAQSELALRNELESFLRARRPNARICHEMVMGERKVRADVVAIDIAHIIACEVKGEWDDTTRLLHQVGMYQLCVPEVWMVVPVGPHRDDAKLIRHLLPSVGLLVGNAATNSAIGAPAFRLSVEAEPMPFAPVPEMALEMMWRDELAAICRRTRVYAVTARSSRAAMIAALLEKLPVAEQGREICTELRNRIALWRADPAISRNGAPLESMI